MLLIKFKLSFKEKLESIIYQGRSLQKDFEEISNLFKNDILFISFNTEISFDIQNCECIVRINLFSFSRNENQRKNTESFLLYSLENKLASINLDDYFYISQVMLKYEEGDTVFDINYNPSQLTYIERQSDAEKRLELINFPLDDIPSNYNCLITSSVMDIPCYDIRAESACMERRAFTKYKRQYKKHPTTNQGIYNDDLIVIDYALRDKILTFVEKAETLNKHGKTFNEPYLYNEQLSKEALEEKLGVILDVNNEDDLLAFLTKAKNNYYAGRYLSAAFYFEKASEFKFLQDPMKKHLYIQCLIFAGIANFKAQKIDKSVDIYEKLKNEPLSENMFIMGIFLVGYIKYQIDQEKYEVAEDSIQRANNLFLLPIFTEQFLRVSDELMLFQQLKFFAKAHVKVSYMNQGKLLRRIAAHDSVDNMGLFFRLFPFVDVNARDANSTKKFTALHLALNRCENRYEMAEILIRNNASLTIPNASGLTAKQIIVKDNEKRLKKLLEPSLNLTLICDVNINPILLITTLKSQLGINQETEVSFSITDKVINLKIFPIYINQNMLEYFIKYVRITLNKCYMSSVQLYAVNYLTPEPNLILEEKVFTFVIGVQNPSYQSLALSSFFSQGRSAHNAFIASVQIPSQRIVQILNPFGIVTGASSTNWYDPQNHQQFKIKICLKVDEQLSGFLLDYINECLTQSSLTNFKCIHVENNKLPNLKANNSVETLRNIL